MSAIPPYRSSDRRVGILVDNTGPYYADSLEGILQYAREMGWQTGVLRMMDFRSRDLLNPDPGVDGIISSLLADEQLRRRVRKAIRMHRLPAVDLSSDVTPATAGICRVLPDDAEAGRIAARHLVQRGYRRLAFVGFERFPFSTRRQRGFAEAATAAGCELFELNRPMAFAEMRNDELGRIGDFLQNLPRPVGVMAANDLRGREVLLAAANGGMRVPEEMSVVAVDDIRSICETCSPSLSSIPLDAFSAGRAAAMVLDRLMAGETCPPITLVPPHRVTVRASSAVLAMDDPEVASAIGFMRDNLARPIGVIDVVAHTMVSRRMLEIRFRRVLGRTIENELVRLRLEHAQALLRETDLAVKQVAFRSGFRTPEWMCMVFRRELATTPTAYRRKLRLRDTPHAPATHAAAAPRNASQFAPAGRGERLG